MASNNTVYLNYDFRDTVRGWPPWDGSAGHNSNPAVSRRPAHSSVVGWPAVNCVVEGKGLNVLPHPCRLAQAVHLMA